MVATVKDVAARAHVSVGTVSNVLNRPEIVSPATAARVRRAIVELGFVRNDAARQLRAGSSRSVGFVILDVANPFFTQIAHGAGDRAAVSGLNLILGSSAGSALREGAYLDAFREQRLAGVLITPVGGVTEQLTSLATSGTPVVLVDRELSGSMFGSVATDHVRGGQLAVHHLLELGRRRIAFVGGPLSLVQVADRLEGARMSVAETPGATLEVVGCREASISSGRRVGNSIVARPRAERPDAIFCANDLLALGMMQVLLGAGRVAVPREIALIGYDDIDFAEAMPVPLSSVRQPTNAIGTAAMELVMQAHERPRAIRFTPKLVARQSTLG